jgi:nucleoside-diphosphate-sugar epimerase
VLGQRTWGGPGGKIHAEDDPFDPGTLAAAGSTPNVSFAGAASRGVRGIVLRPPVLWGPGDHGHLSQIYRSVAVTGAACYVGAGLNSYSTLHIDDAVRLYAAAHDRGRAGALYHGVSGEVTVRALAEGVATDLGCATDSLTRTEAERVWGEFGALIMGSTSRSSSRRTQAELDWAPQPRTLLYQIGEPRLRALATQQVAPSHAQTAEHGT